MQDWYEIHGSDPLYELEVKIKGINEFIYFFIKKRLESFNDWTKKELIECTDITHQSHIRGTIRAGVSPIFIMKKSMEVFDIPIITDHKIVETNNTKKETTTSTSHNSSSSSHSSSKSSSSSSTSSPTIVRFTCSTEIPKTQPLDSDLPINFRLKRRYRYNRKNEFLYELTQVQSGKTFEDAKSSKSIDHEVELEWMGHTIAKQYQNQRGGIQFLVEKFLMKVADLLVMKEEAIYNQELILSTTSSSSLHKDK